MGLFDFVGTFFFLSLGITFVLILLLVYHFKQRLTDMEQKSDKMFEIINTIVKEMGNIRRAISHEATYNQPFIYQTETQPNIEEDDKEEHDDTDNDGDEDNSSDDDNEPVNILGCNEIVYDLGNHPLQEDINKFFNINHPDEEEHEHEHDHEEQVKVVSVDLTYNDEDIKTDDETEMSDDLEDNDEAEVAHELHTMEGVHVNKLDESVIEIENESPVQQISYNKMTLTQLRAYAVSKGLLSDSSKLKKAELIKLLESNEE